MYVHKKIQEILLWQICIVSIAMVFFREKGCKIDHLEIENTCLKNKTLALSRELDDYKVRVQYSLQLLPRGTSCSIV